MSFRIKKGFVLLDTLICCFILAMTAFITYSVIHTHYQIHEDYQEIQEEMEQEWEEFYQNIPACTKCQSEADSS